MANSSKGAAPPLGFFYERRVFAKDTIEALEQCFCGETDFRGYSAEELKHYGANDSPEIALPDLTNDILDIFDHAAWYYKFTSSQWTAMQPVLRLLSHFMTHPVFLPFWATLLFGNYHDSPPRVDIYKESDAKQRLEETFCLLALAKPRDIRLGFLGEQVMEHPGINGGCSGFTARRDKKFVGDEPSALGGTKCRIFMHTKLLDDLVAAYNTEPVGVVNVRTFFMAKLMVHEMAHAMFMLRMPNFSLLEATLPGNTLPELGWAFEHYAFGGHIYLGPVDHHPGFFLFMLNADATGSRVYIDGRWKEMGASVEQRRQMINREKLFIPCKQWLIPLAYADRMLHDKFWNEYTTNFGRMPPRLQPNQDTARNAEEVLAGLLDRPKGFDFKALIFDD